MKRNTRQCSQPTAVLVDPVPDLLNGPAVMTDDTQSNIDTLAAGGQTVKGVAADGVTQVLIRVPGCSAGDQWSFTLYNDLGSQSGSASEDGGLGSLGATDFSQNQVSVVADSTTNNGSVAFALYRAPVDFPRGDGQDADAPSRTVSVQIQDITNNIVPTDTITVTILRPPVELIHGIWSNPVDTWGNFSEGPDSQGNYTPLLSDPRFTVIEVNYDHAASGLIQASAPPFGQTGGYGKGTLQKTSTNSFGFAYNAPDVLEQIQGDLGYFKKGANRVGSPWRRRRWMLWRTAWEVQSRGLW